MKKNVIIALTSLAISAFLWFALIILNPSSLEIYLLISATAFSVLFICFSAICIAQKISKTISPYRVFAICDITIGIAVAAYAIYDITTDVDRFFSGLLGVLLLIFVIPVVAALLIIDFIVWLCGRSKRRKNSLEK